MVERAGGVSREPRSSRVSRAEEVAALIEDELLTERLPVGAHLGRRVEYMARFAISPTIMSETLRILRTRGLVDVRRGTGGGLFVASVPPQIRLGAMDLWFVETSTHPLDLFEARVHLEGALTAAAFDRAGADDIAAMRAAAADLVAASDLAVGADPAPALDPAPASEPAPASDPASVSEPGPASDPAGSGDARRYLRAVMALHRTIAQASKIAVLDGMHQTLVTTIDATLSRAAFIAGYEELLRHSVEVHQALVEAIADRDPVVFAKIVRLHDHDLVRADDPRRSPHAGGSSA